MRIGSIGFFLSLYGDWARGKSLLDKAMSQNIGYPLIYHGATTLYYYRQGDYEAAYAEAFQYDLPKLFWAPMLRVACLGQLGRHEEAKGDIEQLMLLRPDFAEKAKMLISRYVKEDGLVEQVMNGLRKAGMIF